MAAPALPPAERAGANTRLARWESRPGRIEERTLGRATRGAKPLRAIWTCGCGSSPASPRSPSSGSWSVAFVASGAFASGGSGSLPPGTQTFAEPNHSHVPGAVTYDRVPPAGGAHNPTWLNCGVYTAPVPNENAVHSLEHGTVWITYQPTLPADQVAVLQQLVTSHYVGTERYLILSPYVGLTTPIVASAWGAQLSVDQASDSRLRRLHPLLRRERPGRRARRPLHRRRGQPGRVTSR